MNTKYSLFCTIFMGALLAVDAQADTLDDIGFTDLELELGSALPDAGSISVTQVEAILSEACAPDKTLAEFSHITFIDKTSTICTGTSAQATSVATNFYGADTSSSSAIGSVDLFERNDWIFSFLNMSTPADEPKISGTRLANHSWVGNATTVGANTSILGRVDFVVEQDEFIQVVTMSATPDTEHLLSDSFNAIVAGLSNGTSGVGTTALSSVYTAGRARPDIVAPESTVSSASPRVASAAALLMDYAHTKLSLSHGSTYNRDSSFTIYNAERSETIKAALMAGADRNTAGNTNSADITDYRVDAANRTTNGLDTRFGAGQVNVYNSYHVLAAGEQSSTEEGGTTITSTGFDYDSAFGGLNGTSNTVATYSFSTGAIGGQNLKAALVWNLKHRGLLQDDILYDLDLQLIDVTASDAVVASSTSTIDNTENIWFDLASNNEYQLKVIPGVGQPAFEWDYALAWQVSTLPVVTAGQLFSIDENSPVGTSVGTVVAEEVEVDSPITGFAIAGGSTIFAINNSGLITVTGALDYETTPSYTLSITANDGVNISMPVNVVIAVNDIVESSASVGGGGGGSLGLMWLLLPLFITAGRRRVS